eukprot:521432-Prorocentrum_minimum.AAC.1
MLGSIISIPPYSVRNCSQPASQLVSQSVSQLASQSVSQSVCQSVSQQASQAETSQATGGMPLMLAGREEGGRAGSEGG